jgi:hypothetical protein
MDVTCADSVYATGYEEALKLSRSLRDQRKDFDWFCTVW